MRRKTRRKKRDWRRASLKAGSVPILVRPNSNAPGRYIAVFGHRRLAAVKACRSPGSHLILELSDEEALVIQGQENNERKDTTFIEKAVYAWRLKASGMRSVKIAEALATSEAAVSRMISIPVWCRKRLFLP